MFIEFMVASQLSSIEPHPSFYVFHWNIEINNLSNLGGSVVSFEDLDRAIEELFYKSDEGLFQCRECEHVSKQKPNIVNHVEEGLI